MHFLLLFQINALCACSTACSEREAAAVLLRPLSSKTHTWNMNYIDWP